MCVYLFCFTTLTLGSWPKLRQGKEKMGWEQAKAKKKLKQIKGMKKNTFSKLLELTTTLGIGNYRLPENFEKGVSTHVI